GYARQSFAVLVHSALAHVDLVGDRESVQQPRIAIGGAHILGISRKLKRIVSVGNLSSRLQRAVERAEGAGVDGGPDPVERALLDAAQMALKTVVSVAVILLKTGARVGQRIPRHVPIPQVRRGEYEHGNNDP